MKRGARWRDRLGGEAARAADEPGARAATEGGGRSAAGDAGRDGRDAGPVRRPVPPGWRARVARWWRTRPLGVTFGVYLAVYLVVATALTFTAVNAFDSEDMYRRYTIEVALSDGSTVRGVPDSGPYIYNPTTGELLPATEIMVPGESSYAVFASFDADAVPASRPAEDEDYREVYATADALRRGQVELFDWGLNYNESYAMTEILDSDERITAKNIAFYDAAMRAGRADAVGAFERATGVDLAEVFGAENVSNVAYYADSIPSDDPIYRIWVVLTGISPFVVYGGLAWVMFRRFYRVHIAAPLEGLGAAAQRIAEQDLDFSIEPVQGKELGALGATLEDMRASLLSAQRELWRTAEERRRLNAAFAHDLRTPVTVLRGTVDLGRMRLARGAAVGEAQLDALSEQVDRLSRYADAMSGLTKLEDRVLACEGVAARELVRRVRAHAGEVVAARGGGLRLEMLGSESGDADLPGSPEVSVDLPLVEEVLDNLLSNACGHAASTVRLGVRLERRPRRTTSASGEDGGLMEEELQLVCIVEDDGPGFSAEALRRACEPFYSESKSLEHFGVGLNIAHTLTALHGGALELGVADVGGARVVARFACCVVGGAESSPDADARPQG